MHGREQIGASGTYAPILLVADNLYVSLTMGIALHDLMQHLDAAVRGAVVAEDILKVGVRLLEERLGTLAYVRLYTIYGDEDGNCHELSDGNVFEFVVKKAHDASKKPDDGEDAAEVGKDDEIAD